MKRSELKTGDRFRYLYPKGPGLTEWQVMNPERDIDVELTETYWVQGELCKPDQEVELAFWRPQNP